MSSHRPALAPVDAVVARALAKDPANRYSRCEDFTDALRDALTQAGLEDGRTTELVRCGRRAPSPRGRPSRRPVQGSSRRPTDRPDQPPAGGPSDGRSAGSTADHRRPRTTGVRGHKAPADRPAAEPTTRRQRTTAPADPSTASRPRGAGGPQGASRPPAASRPRGARRRAGGPNAAAGAPGHGTAPGRGSGAGRPSSLALAGLAVVGDPVRHPGAAVRLPSRTGIRPRGVPGDDRRRDGHLGRRGFRRAADGSRARPRPDGHEGRRGHFVGRGDRDERVQREPAPRDRPR